MSVKYQTIEEIPADELPRLVLVGPEGYAENPDNFFFKGTLKPVLCATCSMMYLGAVSEDSKVQEECRAAVLKAANTGVRVVYFDLPERTVFYAVTTALSLYFPVPMPVCWTHMIGYNPEVTGQKAAPPAFTLIPGKKNQDWRRA